MNSYSQTTRELFDLQKFSIKMGLENITRLCATLGDPQQAYDTLHVAGTNGKGSTSVLMQVVLSAHGIRTGLYTSPHLIDFRERIRVNGKMINKGSVRRYWHSMAAEINRLKATFFDATTALAFDYFRSQEVQAAVIETGLGGRLDSTNILKPCVAVITPVAVDHTKQLGYDLLGIAAEKAAIIKPGSAVFCGTQKPQVRSFLQKQAGKAGHFSFSDSEIEISNVKDNAASSRFTMRDKRRREEFTNLVLNLGGRHQIENAVLAYLAARWYLESRGTGFDAKKWRRVLRNINWPGRLEIVREKPRIILDVSHNLAGIAVSLNFLAKKYHKNKLHLLIGLLSDKEYKAIADITAEAFKTITVCEPLHERKLKSTLLQKEFLKKGKSVTAQTDPLRAFEGCVKRMESGDTLVVMGSHFIIGHIMQSIKRT